MVSVFPAHCIFLLSNQPWTEPKSVSLRWIQLSYQHYRLASAVDCKREREENIQLGAYAIAGLLLSLGSVGLAEETKNFCLRNLHHVEFLKTIIVANDTDTAYALGGSPKS